jgi:hypothetical protein
MRFTSSLQPGPFSDSQRRPFRGSNAKPIEFRIPYAQILEPDGFVGGVDPSGFTRRIFPRRLRVRSCEFDGWALSPITT